MLAIGLGTFTLTPAQDPQRARTVEPTGTSVSPQPTTAVTPARNGAPRAVPRTAADLKSSIEEIVRQPALERGFFAVKIVSLDTGLVIYEQSANKFVRPASNMKLYTVAAALDRLTPDYHFMTSVYAKEKPDDGKIKGDLIVYGRGDPSFAARFNNGDYFKGINDLADRIVAAGVKRVKGDLVGDESWFNGAPLGSGWEWEDLQWSYGAAGQRPDGQRQRDRSGDKAGRQSWRAGYDYQRTSGHVHDYRQPRYHRRAGIEERSANLSRPGREHSGDLRQHAAG